MHSSDGRGTRRDHSALRRLVAERTDHAGIQFLRYVVVGSAATAVDFGTLALMVDGFGVHYLAANACGFTLGLTTNYLLSVTWVFASRRIRSRATEFAVFGAVGIGGLGISELCMFVGVDLLRVHYAVAKVVSVAFTLIWNFAVRRFLLFGAASTRRQEE